MLAIDNTLVSEDLIEKKFICDLNICKGGCCVTGDSGAPLEEEELKILKDSYEKIKSYIPKEGIKTIEKKGLYVIDEDGDYTTPLIKGKQCAYMYFEKDIAKCSIEKAYKEGKINFQKPISCHLFPVRITKHKGYEAVNYEKRDTCKSALKCGERLNVAVYKFLKEPLIRKYGKEWYEQLEIAADMLSVLEKV